MSNIKCPKCESEYSSVVKFCAKCGAEILKEDDSNLKGVGGWLIIVILGLIQTLFVVGGSFYTSVTNFTDGSVEAWSSIQGLAGAVAFDVVISAFLSVSVIYLLYLMRGKSKKFPGLYIKFLVALNIYAFLGMVILSNLGYPNLETQALFLGEEEDTIMSFITTLTVSLIWGAYMLKSRRVKLTFTK